MMRDVFEIVPGAEGVGVWHRVTTWEVVRNVVLPYTSVIGESCSVWAGRRRNDGRNVSDRHAHRLTRRSSLRATAQVGAGE
jgi:hypothetical protein